MGEVKVMRDALREAMSEEMRRDPHVIVMGEEVGAYQGAYKVTQGMLQEFGGKRVIDTPITEYGFTGLAVGAAFRGLRPVVEFMSFNFSMQAIDHIINSAGKILYMSGGEISCPIVFRGPNGAAAMAGAQHSQCFASWYAHCPGLKVVVPYGSSRAKGLLKGAIRDPNPVVFLESELMYGRSFEMRKEEVDRDALELGKAYVERQGTDVTLVAYGISVDLCLQAAAIVSEKDGIEAEVIDLSTLRPLDTETILRSVCKTHRIISVEEGWPVCGVGAEISALVNERAFDQLDAPVLRVCGADVPMPYARNLEALALPRVADIVSTIASVCSGA